MTTLIKDPIAIITILMLVPAVFAWLKARTNWRLMQIIPPIIWVLFLPITLSNLHILPLKSPVYGEFSSIAIPLFIVLMMLDMNIRNIFKVATKSLAIMIIGAVGIVVGAIVATFLLGNLLPSDVWKSIAPLVASWTGGTGNLIAVSKALDTPQELVSVVVMLDIIIYTAWLFFLLFAKRWTVIFNKFTGSSMHLGQKGLIENDFPQKCKDVEFWNLLLLIGVGLGVIYFSKMFASLMPLFPPVLTANSWEIVIVTSVAVLLSFTPLSRISGANSLSLAMLYIYIAIIGAQSDLSSFRHYPWFIFVGVLCVLIHGFFCVIGARVLKLELPIVAVASAANIGGPAAVSLIAAHHKKELIPIGIIMVMIGYVMGNYLGFLVGQVCFWIMP